MYDELPEFDLKAKRFAHPYTTSVFGDNLINLESYEDGHFRATFKTSFFVLQEGTKEPTKSQWNTLKKRMKRRNPLVFIFRDHGLVKSAGDAEACYFIDFGFFAHA